MGKLTQKLTQKRLDAALKKPGRHSDGDGLFFRTLGAGRAYFIYRFRVHGLEREMSLGPYPEISLADARIKHAALRKQVIADKADPLAARDAERAKRKGMIKLAASGAPTFGAAAEAYLDRQDRKGKWTGPKHRQQWRNTLMGLPETFLDLPTDQIDRKAVHEVLEPIWDIKAETARRLRGRIAAVLDFARGPDDDRRNPAAWEGWLKDKLGEQSKTKLHRKTGERVPRGNHPAMRWQDVPAFVTRLRALGSTAATAFEFLILTASRTGEVIGATWDEVGDLDALRPTWSIPASRMKMDRAHEVPLSARAVEILKTMKAAQPEDSFGPHPYVFAGDRPRRGLSNMAFLMILRRRLEVRVTAHGFRSSFRSWCADTGVPFEVAEASLAHSSSSIVAAYQRSSMVERRRPVMQAWADFVTGKTAAKTAEVVAFPKAAE
jgi:integrase